MSTVYLVAQHLWSVLEMILTLGHKDPVLSLGQG